jgi:hypothetical protein
MMSTTIILLMNNMSEIDNREQEMTFKLVGSVYFYKN